MIPEGNGLLVYISGPIAGMPHGNKPAFATAEQLWKDAGWEVVNPSTFAANKGRPWEKCLAYDLSFMLNCHAVAHLGGWQKSRGASLEINLARVLGLPIYEAQTGVKCYFEKEPFSEPLPGVATNATWTTPAEKPITAIAEELVNGPRQADYGHPLDNFTQIAELWTTMLGRKFTAEEVGLMMIATKLSRELNAPKRDNLIDMAGYAATIDMIHAERKRREA